MPWRYQETRIQQPRSFPGNIPTLPPEARVKDTQLARETYRPNLTSYGPYPRFLFTDSVVNNGHWWQLGSKALSSNTENTDIHYKYTHNHPSTYLSCQLCARWKNVFFFKLTPRMRNLNLFPTKTGSWEPKQPSNITPAPCDFPKQAF